MAKTAFRYTWEIELPELVRKKAMKLGDTLDYQGKVNGDDIFIAWTRNERLIKNRNFREGVDNEDKRYLVEVTDGLPSNPWKIYYNGESVRVEKIFEDHTL